MKDAQNSVIKRIISYSMPYWKPIVAAGLLTLVVNALALAQPLLIKYLIDKGIGGNDLKVFNLIIVGFIILVLFKGIFSYAQGYLMPYGVQQAIRDIRSKLFEHIQYLPLKTIEKFKSGDLMVRVLSDTSNLGSVLGVELLNLANNILIIIGAVAWMVYKDWKMTILILLTSPLVAFTVARFGELIKHATTRSMRQLSIIMGKLQEAISGIKVTKGFAQEEQIIANFNEENENLFGVGMKIAQLSATQTPIVEFLASIGIAVAVWYGGMLVISGKFSIGDIFAFWGYMVMAVNPLNKIASIYSSIQGTLASAQRIFEVMDSEKEDDAPDAVEILCLKGQIAFKNVGFEYKTGVPVLSGVNFEVPPDTILALVGRSGAGKTTTANLIPRYYEPTQGEIFIDGMDIKKIKMKSLRSQLGIVSQETVLFSGTVRENLAYGKMDAGMEEIIAAAKAANAHNFITELPEGYETDLGEKGGQLSTGQRQRIAIARALLKDPRILILDEATSSVDVESEALIQEALERLMKGRTTIVIAHRLSTVRKADNIIVLEKGTVEEKGSHEELVKKGGLYADLVKYQLKGDKELVKFAIAAEQA